MEIKDRIEIGDVASAAKSRFDPIPRPYMLHIRERFNDDGTVEVIHRKRVYDSVLGGCTIIDEKELR